MITPEVYEKFRDDVLEVIHNKDIFEAQKIKVLVGIMGSGKSYFQGNELPEEQLKAFDKLKFIIRVAPKNETCDDGIFPKEKHVDGKKFKYRDITHISKKDSIQILSHSAGLAQIDTLDYNVTFQCDVCYPVEGMVLEASVKNITKAGIRATVSDENNPIIIFLARDLHLDNDSFHNLNIDDRIESNVIGTRFEYGDPCIYIIGELIKKIDA